MLSVFSTFCGIAVSSKLFIHFWRMFCSVRMFPFCPLWICRSSLWREVSSYSIGPSLWRENGFDDIVDPIWISQFAYCFLLLLDVYINVLKWTWVLSPPFDPSILLCSPSGLKLLLCSCPPRSSAAQLALHFFEHLSLFLFLYPPLTLWFHELWYAN